MANSYSSELEAELEQELHELHEMHEGELEGEGEAGAEGEGIFGTIGNVLGGLLGEGEGEGEEESELHELHELHEQHEHHEQHEFEGEGEFEAGEQFFGKAFRGIGRLVKRAAPLLKSIAKVAAPMVGTAIGGPFGGMLGKLASSALGEGELEQEFELHEMHEMEGEGEMEFESESHESLHEMVHEIASHELTHHEALAEMMAEAAAHEQHEGEAEAMVGASVLTTISPRDRRRLRAILPHLVRGVAILTRILRRRRLTRPAVRAIPTIVRGTVKTLTRQAAAGKPITRRAAGRAATRQIRRVLGNPAVCTAAISRNLRTNRTLRRTAQGRRRAA